MKRYIIILITLGLAWALMADVHPEAGNYGYQFLNIPINPVSMALAGRGIHYDSNHGDWLWQPASAAVNRDKSLSASHSAWIGDTAYSSLVYSNSTRAAHFGLGLTNLSYGEIEKRDETGLLIGHYNPSDLNVRGNYALRLAPSLYLGANLGVIYEKLDTASSLALSSDLGTTWLLPVEGSRMSLAVRNLGLSNKTDEIREELPLSLDLDLYKKLSLGEQELGLEASVIKAVDEDLRFALSTELQFLQRLYLRAGYKFNTDAESFSAGLGLKLFRISIDYGFAAFSEGLSDVHSFGLSYQF
ncbi:MAG: PorV/PorQ family protein [Candidatus Cloacimonetes bacterium]|jgi:hypothetical protein|nr:PorV/PorQ family protein [Candidatus Cloacimonadota bacterium]MCB5287976.1 PorV/PorQ family protein [Candidatus Cloacimonadota bacterium]MCK9185102.1 PorV/PorQ family protein [Candidatus Cloacimonadota bacterium]MCK9584326.1 PorV/PorQ family protein [Candidatus Cloacimonadota bacterium]MDY0230298.1 PorV/PorQ family protein [Candidatus Cloacimonadaceae bacterium]